MLSPRKVAIRRHQTAHVLHAIRGPCGAGCRFSIRDEGGTSAPSCRLTTTAGTGGVEGSFETISGEMARFESEVTINSKTSSDTLASQTRLRGHGAAGAGAVLFREAGQISFGGHDHRLSFSTVGQGYLADSAQAGLKHGTVTWRVDSGAGQFAGASGLITSNFTISEAGEVTDHHFGLIFVK